jgi:Acetyltransferases
MYRKATIHDCPTVYHLICDMENRQLPFEQFRTIYRDQLNDRHYYCLVREQAAGVIAVLNLRFEEQLHHADRIAEIMEFAVESAFRNQGIGKEMLEQACLIAKEHGCSQIEVACNQLREKTHRFYLREGMHNFHYKFSKSLMENDTAENAIGK